MVVDTPSAGEQALQEIKKRLNRGDLPNGSRLPPERQFATELGVSRRALREALEQLETEGRVWRGVGHGTVIGGPPSQNTSTAQNLTKTLTSPSELMEARIALEPSVTALAVMHATTQDLDKMHRCLKKSASVSEHKSWDRWDGALHKAISNAAHNAMVTALFDFLNAARFQTQWGQLRKSSLTHERQLLYTRQHQAILAAIDDRNAEEAASCMRTHLLTVRQAMLNPWEEQVTTQFGIGRGNSEG